jgi:hypothetical protein
VLRSHLLALLLLLLPLLLLGQLLQLRWQWHTPLLA